MNKEIMREALLYPEAEIRIRTAKDNSGQQSRDIEEFIRQGVDLLIVSPNEADTIAEVIEEAYGKGIPVLLFDRKIHSDKYTAYVGADNYAIGQSAGAYIATRLRERGKVVELTGLKGSTSAIERHKGLMSVLADYPGVEVVASADAGWFQEAAETAFDSILRKHPDIDLLVAQNDRMAMGAYQAAKRQGREKEMVFVGVDALTGEGFGVDMVARGVLDATFIYPTGGDKIVDVAMAILKGKPYDKETLLSTALVDKANARVMQMQTAHINTLDNKIEALNRQIDTHLMRYDNQRMFLYACVLILALFIVLLLFVVRAFWNKKLMNTELEGQKRELERQRDQVVELSRRLEESTRAKLSFFTNISHDFRTPLTLIIDPINQLKRDNTLGQRERFLLDIIHKNVTVLLRLVNQTLDFRKYENGKLKLHLSRFDLAAGLKEWTEAFRALAYEKHVHFDIRIAEAPEGYVLTTDAEKIERVVYNLLSNAFKFTPENGSVAVELSREGEGSGAKVTLKVTDTGIGISAEDARHIFDDFYQTSVHHAGSGIGLALVKAFVEMHRGRISVQSVAGERTAFAVELPAEQPEAEDGNAPVKTELLTNLREGAVISAKQETVRLPREQVKEEHGLRALVIDDNQDIRDYLRSLLREEYTVYEATNGKEGVRQAMKYAPDIIVCDVMMPVMDGMECCRRLKSEVQTSRIPIIMLTAYDMDEQKIRSYEYGADSYIPKPFNSQVLLARMRNLIESRRRSADNPIGAATGTAGAAGEADRDFLERLYKLIDDNPQTSVEELGERIGLSRVQLYRKTKALTGYPPNELLRVVRLKRAASLLASTDKTVAEVGYAVGFTSPSYFAKCYKEYFGESPTDFIRRKYSS